MSELQDALDRWDESSIRDLKRGRTLNLFVEAVRMWEAHQAICPLLIEATDHTDHQSTVSNYGGGGVPAK